MGRFRQLDLADHRLLLTLAALLPAALGLTRCIPLGRLRPAKPSGWGFARWFGRKKHFYAQSTRAPRYLDRDRWRSSFRARRETAFSNLVSAVRQLSPPWLQTVLALEWLVLLLMDCGANLLNRRTTIDGDSAGRRFLSDFRCLTWTGLIVRTYASTLRGLRCVRRQVRELRRLGCLLARSLTISLGLLALSAQTVARHGRLHHIWTAGSFGLHGIYTLLASLTSGACLRRILLFLVVRLLPIGWTLRLVRLLLLLSRQRRACLRRLRHGLRRLRQLPIFLPHIIRVAVVATLLVVSYV
jgi:hypothetical protein